MYPELFTIPGINLPVPGYGALLILSFLGATWWSMHLAKRVKADPDIALNIGIIALVFSAFGARTFYVVHYWDEKFADDPASIFRLAQGGFEFYGGFVGALLASIVYLCIKRLSIRLYADIVAPSLLLGMGIGRIGCFLSGCCWGGPCSERLPWAVHFPMSSPPHQRQWEGCQVTLPAELVYIMPAGSAAPLPRSILKLSIEDLKQRRDQTGERLKKAEADGDARKTALVRSQYAKVDFAVSGLLAHFEQFDMTPSDVRALTDKPEFRSNPVHPAQLYGAVGPILLAWICTAYFYRRKQHGAVAVLGLMVYAVERFIEEIVRIDNPRDTLGLTVSQGISIAIFCLAGLWYFVLQRMPLRSSWSACPPKKPDKTDAEPAADPSTG